MVKANLDRLGFKDVFITRFWDIPEVCMVVDIAENGDLSIFRMESLNPEKKEKLESVVITRKPVIAIIPVEIAKKIEVTYLHNSSWFL